MLRESSPAAALRLHRARLPGIGRPGNVRPANLALQTPPPGQARWGDASESTASRGAAPSPAAAARSAGLSCARWLGGEEGGGAAAPLKWAAARTGAAKPWSEGGRAFVYVSLQPAQVPPATPPPKSVASSALLPFLGPAASTTPPCTLLPAQWLEPGNGTGSFLLPLFAREPGGRTGTWGQTGPCHFQKKKDEKGASSLAGVRKRSSPAGMTTLGVVWFIFWRALRPPSPSQSRTGGGRWWKQVRT